MEIGIKEILVALGSIVTTVISQPLVIKAWDTYFGTKKNKSDQEVTLAIDARSREERFEVWREEQIEKLITWKDETLREIHALQLENFALKTRVGYLEEKLRAYEPENNTEEQE